MQYYLSDEVLGIIQANTLIIGYNRNTVRGSRAVFRHGWGTCSTGKQTGVGHMKDMSLNYYLLL